MRNIIPLLLVLSFLGCVPPPPRQVSKSTTQGSEQKLEFLRKRINAMEKIVGKWSTAIKEIEKANRQSRADQSVLFEDLRTELKTLKGSLDLVRHDLEQAERENQKVRQDFDQRFLEVERHSEARRALARPSSKKKSKSSVDAITRYNQILRIILDKKDYNTAIAQFGDFIKEYPKTSLAANARYWIGEGYFAKADYPRAIVEFQKVADNYPKSEKTCDARLKQGYAFAENKQKSKAKLFLQEVVRRCPNTKTATRAKNRIAQLSK